MRNKVVLKINWFDLCEKAWFPWQPAKRFSRMAVYLQKSRKRIDGIETSQKRETKCLPVNP